MTLNKKEILEKINARILKTETIHINDWDSDVFIREMNGETFVNISSKCLIGSEVDNKLFLIYAIIESTYDLNKEPIFDNNDQELVRNLPADVYSDLVSAVTRLNNIGGVSKVKN